MENKPDRIDWKRTCKDLEAECQKVPDGYVLVPMEPTASQLDVAVSFALNVKLCNDYNWSAYMRDVYARMIAAAPKPDPKRKHEIVPTIAAPVAQEPVAFYIYKETAPRLGIQNVVADSLPWVYDQDPSSGFSARLKVYLAPPDQSAEAQAEINMALDLDDARERIAELEATIEAQRTLYANASKIANENDELERQRNRLVTALQAETGKLVACEKRQEVLVEALETCTPEGFCDYDACSAALASVKGNAGNERTAD